MVGVGAIPRILLAAGALPAPFTNFTWSDILFTWQRGLAGGHVPYWDAYFEYPPLDGYLSALFATLVPSPVAYVSLWSILQVAAAATVAWALPRDRAQWWAWALAPQLALFGPMNFDLLAIAALVIALRWDDGRAHFRSIVALAAGTAAKLFPATALPLFFVRRPIDIRGATLRLALFSAVIAACYAPSAGARFSSLESLTRYSVGIGANFDSVWGIAGGAMTVMGLPAAPILVIVTSMGLLATYLLVVVPAARRTRDPVVPVALAILTVLIWSRLYSPQFSLWVLPFFAMGALPIRAFALLTAADAAVFLSIYPLTLVEHVTDEMQTLLLAVLAASIVLRHAALLGAWVSARRTAGFSSPS